MLAFICDIIESLLANRFFSWLANRKRREAQDAKNKAELLSDAAAIDELRKWTRD